MAASPAGARLITPTSERLSVKPISSSEMRRVEEACEALGITRLLLMENAGNALARQAQRRLQGIDKASIVVVAGLGNNGGDGFVAARHLAGMGYRIDVFLLGRSEGLRTEEARVNFSILKRMEDSVRIREVEALGEEEGKAIEGADLVMDAILGTGVKGSIKEPFSTAIDAINRCRGFRLAVDIPTGLDPDSGQVHDKAVRAHLTVTFHRPKKGLLNRSYYTGEVVVEPIGVPPEADPVMRVEG